MFGPQADRGRVRVFEVLADHRAFGDDPPVIRERGDLAARVDRLEPVAVMLELARVEPVDGELAPELELLEQREHRLQRIGHRPEAVERQHGRLSHRFRAA
jgi:hypothetical protein